jgi:hypothetical protein
LKVKGLLVLGVTLIAATAAAGDEHLDMVEAGGAELPPPAAAEAAGMVFAGDRKPALKIGSATQPR